MTNESEKPKETEKKSGWKALSRRKLLAGVGIILAIFGVGAPVGYWLVAPSQAPKDEGEKVSIDPEMAVKVVDETMPVEEGSLNVVEGEEGLGVIVPFEMFLVNLSGGKYLRLQLQAEMETPDIPQRLHARIVPIRDSIITMLTQKTALELEDPQGKDNLKNSIKDIINEQLRQPSVKRIYFTQFVIQ